MRQFTFNLILSNREALFNHINSLLSQFSIFDTFEDPVQSFNVFSPIHAFSVVLSDLCITPPGIQYDKTTLTFFKNDVGVNKSFEKENSLFAGNLDGLTQVFNLFRKIALASFLIILVYMGIRVLLMAGDARRKAKYKEVIFDWIRGVIILVFFPYVIRYIILINHAFVVYVGDKAKDIGIQGATIQSVDGSIDDIEAINANNLNSSDNPDYMEQMYLQAKESMRITDALCWLVMLIQVIQFFVLNCLL